MSWQIKGRSWKAGRHGEASERSECEASKVPEGSTGALPSSGMSLFKKGPGHVDCRDRRLPRPPVLPFLRWQLPSTPSAWPLLANQSVAIPLIRPRARALPGQERQQSTHLAAKRCIGPPTTDGKVGRVFNDHEFLLTSSNWWFDDVSKIRVFFFSRLAISPYTRHQKNRYVASTTNKAADDATGRTYRRPHIAFPICRRRGR